MTGSNVRLVQIGPFDNGVVSVLHGECFDDEPWDESAVTEVLAMPGTFGFIAVKTDIPAGFVIARVAADECEIISLGVCPALRQAGLGRTLLKAAVDHAAVSEARAVILEVAEDNAAARRLYASAGFMVIGRREAYYRREDPGGATALVLGRRTP